MKESSSKKLPSKSTSKPPASPSNTNRMGERAKESRLNARLTILIAFHTDKKTTVSKLVEEIGAKSTQTVSYHINKLRAQGLLVEKFSRNGPRLTLAGEQVAKYSLSIMQGESVYNKMARKYLGGLNRDATQAVKSVVDDLDLTYSILRQGLHRYDPKLGRPVLDRKVSAEEKIKAARKYSTTWLAAGAVGLTRGAYEDGLVAIFKDAARRLEAKKEKDKLIDALCKKELQHC